MRFLYALPTAVLTIFLILILNTRLLLPALLDQAHSERHQVSQLIACRIGLLADELQRVGRPIR